MTVNMWQESRAGPSNTTFEEGFPPTHLGHGSFDLIHHLVGHGFGKVDPLHLRREGRVEWGDL